MREVSRGPKGAWAILALAAGLLAATISVAMARGSPPTTDIAVLVNSKNPIQDISLSDLRQIFRGERQFWNGKLPVMLLIRAPGSQARDVTLRVVYQTDEPNYRK